MLDQVGTKFLGDFGDYSKVVIGDENSRQFRPCARFEKWNGECSFQMRTPTRENVTPLFKNDVVGWLDRKNDIEVRFYPLPRNPHFLETGGIEYEVILYRKPASPLIPFEIEMQGVDAFYQPLHLTGWEIGRATRPDNAKGSYAFYHSRLKHGRYKTGKAFHLYRPTATDARGAQVFGEWQRTNHTLTAIFGPTWLSHAAYPVIIGPTLGYTSIGVSSAAGFAYIIAQGYQMPSNGTLTAFNIYTDTSSGSGNPNWTVGVYDGNSTDPSTLLVDDSGGPLGGDLSWKQRSLSASLVSGNYYWLTTTNQDPVHLWFYDLASPSAPRSYQTPYTYNDGTLPASFPSPTKDTAANHSWYIDYTATGGIQDDYSFDQSPFLEGVQHNVPY